MDFSVWISSVSVCIESVLVLSPRPNSGRNQLIKFHLRPLNSSGHTVFKNEMIEGTLCIS